MLHSHKLKKFSLIVFVPLILIFFTACSDAGASTKSSLKLAPLESMPAEVKSAPVTVQQAYQFAVANPDVMTHIPCYCGCGAMGHTSNYACYVSDVDSQGNVTFDTHALSCSICVDITQDTMRLMGQGKTVPEIKSFIDLTYSQYGTSNIP